jgi:putative tryptophan/tyrosine transport system substrate-binding protein
MSKSKTKSILCVALCGMLFALDGSAEAQQATKVRKIGFLKSDRIFPVSVDSFRHGMRELGYIEGQNIVIEYRSGAQGELIELANELVRQKVEVIVTSGPAARPAKTATDTIPIVFNFSGDPVEAGFINSLARPGGNMTGVTQLAFELVGKRLEILKEAVPGVSRVGVLASPLHAGEQRELRETQSTARGLGTALQHNQVKNTSEVSAAFDKIVKDKANALLVFPDPVTNAHHMQIVEFAVKHRLPSMFGRREPVDAGGLMSYGPNLDELYRRIPVYVDKILKGAKPADLPVEQPTKFELVINLKTAKQIGLTIPPSVLYRADKVIK